MKIATMNTFKKGLAQNRNPDQIAIREGQGRSLYFDEDAYCQAELLPRENFSSLEKENKKIEDFVSDHLEGSGLSDMYLRNGHQIKTSERKIQLADFEKILLACGFQKCPKVYTGYGSHEELCENTLGFELDASAIYCDYNDSLIENIWIDNFRFSNKSHAKSMLINGLYALGKQWNLILNDWNLTASFDLLDKSEIESYINEE